MNIMSFLRRNSGKSEPKRCITGTQRDYSQLRRYDTALKIWLPEMVDLAVREMAEYHQLSIADFIRQSLFVYLYGRYDLAGSMEQGGKEFTALWAVDTTIKVHYSRTSFESNRTSDLGKNNYDVKIMIAKKMKSDFQQLADESQTKLSEFIREILISSLIGHAYLSERKEMLSLAIEIEVDES